MLLFVIIKPTMRLYTQYVFAACVVLFFHFYFVFFILIPVCKYNCNSIFSRDIKFMCDNHFLPDKNVGYLNRVNESL